MAADARSSIHMNEGKMRRAPLADLTQTSPALATLGKLWEIPRYILRPRKRDQNRRVKNYWMPSLGHPEESLRTAASSPWIWQLFLWSCRAKMKINLVAGKFLGKSVMATLGKTKNA
jgi:hypothetical protein